MITEKLRSLWKHFQRSIKEHFRFATLDMIFILMFVNVFQAVFGAENSIVGVIFTILMASSMARDLTAAPVRHFFRQALVLSLMTTAACLVSSLDPWEALPINFFMVFFILYAFTYEYASHLYFPYILSYLFLVFISPVPPAGLPKRLLGVLTGAVCIMIYQMVMGGRRIHDITRDALTQILDEALDCVGCLLAGKGKPVHPEEVRKNLCSLCRIVYERRKRALCVSDASFGVIDSGRGLEHLILLLYDLEGPVTPARAKMLRQISGWLNGCRKFIQQERKDLPPLERTAFLSAGDPSADEFYNALVFLQDHLLLMTRPDNRKQFHRTMLSFSVRLKAALDVSPVRVTYALRVAVLLAAATLCVQKLQLPHGKWLIFTLASVSLPYADDVGAKAKKRLTATIIGGVVALAAFSMVSSSAGRTALMILSGYCSFFFTGYTGTFSCSTIGALGGAVFMSSFGWGQVPEMAVIRLGYVGMGVLLALLVNCAVLPFQRKTATQQLLKKYVNTTRLLTRICQEASMDPQLYYSLVIQAHLLEEKLRQNFEAAGWDGMNDLLKQCRAQVRAAHRVSDITRLTSA